MSNILFLFVVILSMICGVLMYQNNTLQRHCNGLQVCLSQSQWIISEYANGNLNKSYQRLYKN